MLNSNSQHKINQWILIFKANYYYELCTCYLYVLQITFKQK